MKLTSISKAAAEIGVVKSALAAYVRKYPELVRRRTRRAFLVNVAEVRAHRAEHLDTSKLRHRPVSDSASATFPRVEPPEPSTPAAPDEVSSVVESGPLAKARIAEHEARAEKIQLEVARVKKELVSVRSVQDGAFEAGKLLREQFERLSADLAPKLAMMTDPKEIRTLIENECQSSLSAASESLSELAAKLDQQAR